MRSDTASDPAGRRLALEREGDRRGVRAAGDAMHPVDSSKRSASPDVSRARRATGLRIGGGLGDSEAKAIVGERELNAVRSFGRVARASSQGGGLRNLALLGAF